MSENEKDIIYAVARKEPTKNPKYNGYKTFYEEKFDSLDEAKKSMDELILLIKKVYPNSIFSYNDQEIQHSLFSTICSANFKKDFSAKKS